MTKRKRGCTEPVNSIIQGHRTPRRRRRCSPRKSDGTKGLNKACSLRKQASRNLCFSPLPQIHEFDTNSPTTRRLEVKTERADKLPDDVILEELMLRGISVGAVSMIDHTHTRLLNSAFAQEYKEELESYELDSSGSLEVLKSKCSLLNEIVRRTYVYSIYSGQRELPIEMSKENILKELQERRVSPVGSIKQQLNFEDLSPSSFRRKDLIEYLETVLLKESSGLRVPGYEFGKTLVTSTDIVNYQYELNFGDEVMVDEAEFEAEEEQVEETLREKFKKTFNHILSKELELRNLDSKKDIWKSKKVESTDINSNNLDDNKSDEETEVESDKENSMFSTMSMFRFLAKMPNAAKVEPKIANPAKELFNILFKSSKWQDDYAEISDENVVTETGSTGSPDSGSESVEGQETCNHT